MAADYDLAINDGRVMDPETSFDGVRNVGVKDGKIAVITANKITGKETIDAKGLVPRASSTPIGTTPGSGPTSWPCVTDEPRSWTWKSAPMVPTSTSGTRSGTGTPR